VQIDSFGTITFLIHGLILREDGTAIMCDADLPDKPNQPLLWE
jgi:hypothetical protein